jgi:hypothetical protein
MATISGLLDALRYSWSVFSSSRMLNRVLPGFFPWSSHLQQRRCVRLPSIVTVKKRHQPPMQPLHDGSYHCKPHFGIATTNSGSICLIEGAVHRLPVMLQRFNLWWYFSNTIDMNSCNCFTCKLFNSMAEVIIDAIYTNLISVYSVYLNFCNRCIKGLHS